MIRKFLVQKALPFSDKAPHYYVVGHEPTIRCNLKCKMCYQGDTRTLRKEELNTEQVLTIYKKLKDKTLSIKLVGGEPFMRSDIIDLIQFWDEAGKNIILQTNCSLMTDARINSLSKFKNIIDIATSLDGPPAIHDVIRGVPGTFNRSKNAILSLRTHLPNVSISVFTVMLVEDNLDYLNELIDLCCELKINSLQLLFEQFHIQGEIDETMSIFEQTFGWQEHDYQLNTHIKDPAALQKIDPGELKRKLHEIRSHGMKTGCYANYNPFIFYYNLPEYLSMNSTKTFCLKLLKPELRINQRGDMIWCDIIEKSFGNLLEKTPDELWCSAEYQAFRNYLFTDSFPVCKRCCKAILIN
ncbi:MAG: hypothetical protein A2Y62_14730 [Candidatus Fischerbacteria bacterium RBG_13_37_8]|uniref:Radical SAM core domain-containing protein n=1 Tax=Candidatus Fischerbacteria bacterium RBG_13_37_8 TaxID=1817863 RepID=A0A1F5VMR7_9BACT|nr:MAG: hypothetical protein A2Y62_14730 [Candidatus Fischerbacteria bacterium RBG_13_37_8]